MLCCEIVDISLLNNFQITLSLDILPSSLLNKHLNKYAKNDNSSAQSVSDINHISSLYKQDFIVATL